MGSNMHKLCGGVAVAAIIALPLACSSGDAPSSPGSAGNSSGGQSSAGSSANPTAGANTNAGTASGGTTGTAGNNATAGTTSNAGASNGGNAGTGSGGMSGGGSGGASPTVASPGCGTAAGQALNSWVEQPKLNVAGTDRQWWVWLPTNYDPTKAYPLIFNFHGCGSSDNIVPMNKVTGDKAILVRGTGVSPNVCWDSSANGNDVKFFDQMLADVVAKRCVDTTRVFATGYSSGSWLVNTLNCQRGDLLRASGTVSGGVGVDTSECPGSANPAKPPKPREFARIFVHDQDDTTNPISAGDDKELPRLVAANHCMPKSDNNPLMEAPAPCARYKGCDAGFPVIWCQTSGNLHQRQDSLAPGAFWGLFSSL